MFDGVDGLRALAAFAVLFHHVGFDTGTTFRTRVVGDLVARGDIGVPIFFAISGFLLYRPFAAARVAGAPGPDARTFWWRRALRIFPAFWLAAVVLTVVFGERLGEGLAPIQRLTLTHIYRPATALGALPHTWSLAVELSFYAVLPGLAWLINRASRTAASAPMLAPLLLALVSVTYHLVVELIDPAWKSTMLLWLPAHLEQFAIGMALAEWSVAEHRGAPLATRSARVVRSTVWGWWLMALVAYGVVSLAIELPKGLAPFSGTQVLTRQLLYCAVTIGVLTPTVFAGSGPNLAQRVLRWRPLAFCGVISYGIYLWHKTLSVKWVDWTGGDHQALDGAFVPTLVGTMASSILIAWLSHRFWEEPVNRWLGRRGNAARRP